MTEDDNDDTPPRRTLTGPYPVVEVPVPRTMFEQQLDERVDRTERHLASLLTSRRIWRWISGLGIPVLLTAMLWFVGYSVGQISASAEHVGETRAEIRALGKLIDLLEAQIADLRRHAGLDIHGVSGGRVGVIP